MGNVIGWDMTAALALGRAMGIDGRVLAEFLPPAEAAMVSKLREQQEADRHD
ncbi:MAG: hypothetical protein MUE98_00185 [Rhodobacteraceae bacterium]|jgi:hypothetical protein|nr:hypothetical protein [Paracoccaceae bacterium]